MVGTYEGGDLEGGAGGVRTGGEPGPARPQHLHPCHHPCRLACLTGLRNYNDSNFLGSSTTKGMQKTFDEYAYKNIGIPEGVEKNLQNLTSTEQI